MLTYPKIRELLIEVLMKTEKEMSESEKDERQKKFIEAFNEEVISAREMTPEQLVERFKTLRRTAQETADRLMAVEHTMLERKRGA